MALYGYARVSTLDQNIGIQRAALKAAGCDVGRPHSRMSGRFSRVPRSGARRRLAFGDLFLGPYPALIAALTSKRPSRSIAKRINGESRLGPVLI